MSGYNDPRPRNFERKVNRLFLEIDERRNQLVELLESADERTEGRLGGLPGYNTLTEALETDPGEYYFGGERYDR